MTEQNMNQDTNQSTIVLGGGCFWCTEAVFLKVRGVLSVESGYSNGQVARPTYEEVCTGRTGCVEVIKVEFDPTQISLDEIFQIFFVIHDPTTLNRQGHDAGTQYRSGIYTSSPEQAEQARQFIAQLAQQGAYPSPIVTEVQPLKDYSAAEAYHQNYFERNPYQGYCAHVVAPKVDKFRRTFADRVRV
jgi:peptide-methionine (S)-S-oxide reductase